MDSVTKPKIEKEQLFEICSLELGEACDSYVELKDGWFNAAFLLKTVSGREAVLKVAPPESVRVMRYERNIMAAEVSALRLAKERTSLPVPEVLAYDTSRSIVASEYFITDRLSGRPLNFVREGLTPELQERVDRKVGDLLRELHAVQGTGFGTFEDASYGSWADAFVCMLDWLKLDAEDVGVVLPEQAFSCAERHLWALAEVPSAAFVHWDLWDGNIFVEPDTGEVVGLIDFERAMWADPLIEQNFREPDPALLEAYGGGVLESEDAKARRLLYDLHLFLIMVIECRFRNFEPGHEAWCREQLDGAIRKCLAGP